MFSMRHTLSRLRSYFILDPLIFLYTAVCGAVSLLSSFFDKDGSTQHNIARFWSWLILKTCMSPVEVIGIEKLDTSKPYVYAANHISAMDIPVLYAYLPIQFRIVAVIDIFRRPVVGWHLRRSGQIPIDMTTPRATFKSLHNGIEDLKQGLSVVIFPEGSRSPDGEIKQFFNGAFYMATKAHVPVVPLTIVGTYEMLPMNTFHIKPQRLKLFVGEPISTEGLTTHDLEKLAEATKRAIAETYSTYRNISRTK
jgi:1-acyl-sn-glycerol-3-phosphate acyltransferase